MKNLNRLFDKQLKSYEPSDFWFSEFEKGPGSGLQFLETLREYYRIITYSFHSILVEFHALCIRIWWSWCKARGVKHYQESSDWTFSSVVSYCLCLAQLLKWGSYTQQSISLKYFVKISFHITFCFHRMESFRERLIKNGRYFF